MNPTNPKITIFNGRKRQLGGETTEVYAQVNVSFREDLHLLKGAPLAVFLAISLHANEHGWAWPSRKLLKRETGYNIRTISFALTKLCKTKINGQRLLLKYQPKKSGSYDSNHYLIFPSPAEILQYEGSQLNLPCIQNVHTVAPCVGFLDAENLYAENPLTKNNHIEEDNDDDDKNRHNYRLPPLQSIHRSPSATIESITTLYESEIDGVTSGVTQRLIELLKQYPLQKQWDIAFNGIVMSSIRRLDYLTTCLENAGKPKTVKPE